MPRHGLLHTVKARFRAQHNVRQYSSQHFRVVEHIARCQHTRDRPAGVELYRDNALRLSVKQYIPKDYVSTSQNDVTLIGAHANGFPKELYEPLWDDIYESLRASGKRIRGIWIADQYNQGQSGVYNEDLLGNDPSWWDHGRDLLSIINQFQDGIPHPIIGVGHSMGATQLAYLSLLHPRLLDALVLIDPVIQIPNPGRKYGLASTYRRDLWSSRSEAAQKFANSKFYQKWDPRTLESWIEHGLRELPTEQYPDAGRDSTTDGPPVTLTTAKAQEVYHFQRPAYHDERMLDAPGREDEMQAEDIDDFPMYRPEPAVIFRDLPRIRPPTMYVFGETSELSSAEARRDRVEATGVGLGGSGGKAKGRVEEVVLDCGHLVPMEQTRACAEAVAGFVDRKVDEYEDTLKKRQEVWGRLTRAQRVEINDKWRAHIGEPPKRESKTSDKPAVKG